MTNQATDITILRIEGSLRRNDSTSRQAGDLIVRELLQQHPSAKVVVRDLADGFPLIDADWTTANFTPEEDRNQQQRGVLAFSDLLIDELAAADIVVMGVPMYNFAVPAAMKSWVDHIARARKTFRYTEKGPVGLLADRPVYVAAASGGTPIGSAYDHATPYIKRVLAFVGINNVTVADGGKLVKGDLEVESLFDTATQDA